MISLRRHCKKIVLSLVIFVSALAYLFREITVKNHDPFVKINRSKRRPVATKTSVDTVDIVNDYYPFVDFKFVLPDVSPKVETQNIFMIVLVNSGSKGNEFRKRREAIRQTWGGKDNCEQGKASRDKRLKDLNWLVIFALGKAGPGRNKDDELNMAEASRHNDIMIGNITDNYYGNIIKLYMGIRWITRLNTKYIMKADDDVYVRIPRVLEYLVNAKFPKPFYGGTALPPTLVHREIGNKWTISWQYYGKTYYPRFNGGAFFILSSDLLKKLLNYVYIRKPFHTDDAYVGVAMNDLKVNVTKINSFRLKPKTRDYIRAASDCELLGYNAFGHRIDPQSLKNLHLRFQSHLCTNISLKC
ncbi:UDP-GalNAc:beta-1,3-N-acetylgalactosaminyltransferase 1-like [Dendronephthya gigantea]|uniref:UDP-GalNAc:beta-1, 3-N-acetylgalactosaminyltransferase 1-like n=1 Tax=Dendronephthya gigantea TaxID=151771 RepID=UPI00106D6552|nr:UDP-GalNAc:beta-1,3-N-acetylgalactosaminyltransferase 1-like [Dendronephthya gigantea]